MIGRGLFLLVPLLLQSAPTHAQYPNRTLRLVVPFGAGSANDIVARMIGSPLSEALGRQVVIDNRPGAGGNIGAELVVHSPADGYTVMMGNISHAIAMTLYHKPGYDLVKDFAPVTQLTSASFLLAAHPSVPAKSVKALIALAKAHPGEINVATAGAGVYLAAQLFSSMTGIKMTLVSYRSTPQAVTALIGGEVSVGFPATSAALPHVGSGKLRGLAVTGARRVSIVPDLPTVSEAGVPGYEASPWYGLLVRSGTPAEIISRLHAESVRVLNRPDVQERSVATTDFQMIGSTPKEFATYIVSEVAKWGKIVKATGLRPD